MHNSNFSSLSNSSFTFFIAVNISFPLGVDSVTTLSFVSNQTLLLKQRPNFSENTSGNTIFIFPLDLVAGLFPSKGRYLFSLQNRIMERSLKSDNSNHFVPKYYLHCLFLPRKRLFCWFISDIYHAPNFAFEVQIFTSHATRNS